MTETTGYTGPGHFVGEWTGRIGGAIGGGSLAGRGGAVVGQAVCGKIGAGAGKLMDQYCIEEGKKIQEEYDWAISNGMNPMEASRYAVEITGWEDY